MNSAIPVFRFAPSPTGGLHIGTARTALFNYLAAKSANGKLVLRIEDTDIKRSTNAFENAIINDLKWLGLEWNEFYRQSERLDIYRREAEKLVVENKAYRCFCSSQRLESIKEKLIAEGKPTGYDNRCRNLNESEIKEKIDSGAPFAIRYKVEPCEISFNDLIRGEIKFSSEVISDFIILKSDGTPSYNFAVVVDDYDMKITHILRGEDHITNTARQIMLFKSFGYKIPLFAHLSMILGKDGSKLSKRHGSTTITQFREAGYLSEALANYLSLLSWAPRDGSEIFSIKEIKDKFKINEISKNPAIFDNDKLNWLNAVYIRSKTDEEILEIARPFIESDIDSPEKNDDNSFLKQKYLKIINAFKDKSKTLHELSQYFLQFFNKDIMEYENEALEILKLPSSIKVLDLFEKILEEEYLKNKSSKEKDPDEIKTEKASELISVTGQFLKTDGIKGKLLFMPLRAGLTGNIHGPELPKIMAILGLKDCLDRIAQTKIKLGEER